MPLSEDEQRILKQIEQQLKESDPHLAREVSEYTLYRLTFRKLRWCGAGFLGGLAFLVATLGVSHWLAFGGFLIMLVSALGFDRNLRRLGRAGVASFSQRRTGRSLRDSMQQSRRRLHERLRRDEPDDA